MLVLHAHWMDGALRLWGESLEDHLATLGSNAAGSASPSEAVATASRTHPFACIAQNLRERLAAAGIVVADSPLEASPLRLRLPCDNHGPWPSDRLAGVAGAVDRPVDPWLEEFELEALTVPNEETLGLLLRLEDFPSHRSIDFSPSVRYWIAVAKFIVDLLVDQRFIPTLIQSRDRELNAAWQPWLHDEDVRARVGALLAAMPPVVRAGVDADAAQPWSILDSALRELTDAAVRAALVRENFIDAIDGRDPQKDPHVAWLAGLLDRPNQVSAAANVASDLLRDAGLWVGRLDDTGQNRPLHLCLKLNEPSAQLMLPLNGEAESVKSAEPVWVLSLHLQSPDDRNVLFDAQQIWGGATMELHAAQHRIDHPAELLLAELGRASRLYPKIESVLSERAPTHINLSTDEAYEFLREVRPVLEESGFGVIAPAWWSQPVGRLGARLHVEAPGLEALPTPASGTTPAASMLGLNSLVNFRWQVAIGDQPLTMEEFSALAQQTAPLVQVRGRWIEISPEQLAEAKAFLEQTPDGQMTLLEAIQIAHGAGSDDNQVGLPVFGMDATGWVADVLGASGEDHRMPVLDQPSNFIGTLRPYQKTGLSWMAFLDRFGLGACLADDMGLGKTIQFIAMLLHERGSETGPSLDGAMPRSLNASGVGPTLLIVPTSVVANWVRETARFAPLLRVHVHHGPERATGDRFVEQAVQHDLVVTTYPLVSRDQETLKRVKWHRVCLDEAQYIKNPPTKQTAAIRALHAPRRLALTGTPVENRLSELWSIMEFCNPGYLGSAGEFRRRFAIPVERHRNQRQAEHLRQMVRPFVLRRVKTDPNVIDDLPDLVETKEFATLTAEQAALYQHVVNQMLGEVDRSQGIQRRGLVLATLVKLKQICNHPAQLPASTKSLTIPIADGAPQDEDDSSASGPIVPPNGAALSARSGKAHRLMEMLEEVLAAGDKALIFTQFRQMGHLLASMIQSDLDAEPMFLHGGTPANKRQHLIDRFQSPTGGAPIFILSLKAGGLGLNLTAANHVFHFDRWWNPAVENQATDRAFRIGQTRTVHVHKFVCVGTLEERIDQMIEQKMELAKNIIGAGEQWLTELSTGQLHDLLTLRTSAVEADT